MTDPCNTFLTTAGRAGVALLSLALLLSGCTRDEDRDYCKNHYRFHHEHLDTLAVLEIDLDNEGVLSTLLRLPASAFDDLAQMKQQLSRQENVYTLQIAGECQATSAEVGGDGDAALARYRSSCGSERKLEQINVTLFQSLPKLDEVLVDVKTPATAKHFAISRQCDRAIFRLESKPASR